MQQQQQPPPPLVGGALCRSFGRERGAKQEAFIYDLAKPAAVAL